MPSIKDKVLNKSLSPQGTHNPPERALSGPEVQCEMYCGRNRCWTSEVNSPVPTQSVYVGKWGRDCGLEGQRG